MKAMMKIILLSAFLSTHAWANEPLSELTQKVFQEAEQMNQGAGLPDLENAQTKKVFDQSLKLMRDINPTQLKSQNLPIVPELLDVDAPPIDISQLSRDGAQLLTPPESEGVDRYETQILVFISSSMPDTVVKNYLDQTRKINAAVVMRGLINDSFMDTQKYLARVLEKDDSSKQPTILIDPTLFSRFGIEQVPITVVTEEQIQPCKKDFCPAPVHHKVAGDVSLAWALGLVSRQIDSTSLKEKLRPIIKSVESL